MVDGVVAAIIALAAVLAALASLHAAPSTPASCARGQLGVRANGTNGDAGTIHGAWVFTNLSGTACTLSGYPDMQLYGRAGRRLGHLPFELQRRGLRFEAVPDVGRCTDHGTGRRRVAVHPRGTRAMSWGRERLGGARRRASCVARRSVRR